MEGQTKDDKGTGDRWRCGICCLRNEAANTACYHCGVPATESFDGLMHQWFSREAVESYATTAAQVPTPLFDEGHGKARTKKRTLALRVVPGEGTAHDNSQTQTSVANGGCLPTEAQDQAHEGRSAYAEPPSGDPAVVDSAGNGSIGEADDGLNLHAEANQQRKPDDGEASSNSEDDDGHGDPTADKVTSDRNDAHLLEGEQRSAAGEPQQRAWRCVKLLRSTEALQEDADSDSNGDDEEDLLPTLISCAPSERAHEPELKRAKDLRARATRCRDELERAALDLGRVLEQVSLSSEADTENTAEDTEKTWWCDVCYSNMKGGIPSCTLCGAPRGRTFMEELAAESKTHAALRTGDALMDDSDGHGEDSSARHDEDDYMATSTTSLRGWACIVCGDPNTMSLRVCSTCGTERKTTEAEDQQVLTHTASLAPQMQRYPRHHANSSAPRTVSTTKKNCVKSSKNMVTRSKKVPRRAMITRRQVITRSAARGIHPTTVKSAFENAKWPSSIPSLRHHFNPLNVRFEYDPPFTRLCGCDDDCRHYTCQNGKLNIFCAKNCCSQGGKCGNSIQELDHLRLVHRRGSSELTVLAGEDIDAGVVVGEYLGVLDVGDEGDEDSADPKTRSSFRLKLKRGARSHPHKKIFIDAKTCGSITRFLNHSCAPAARFHEVSNGRSHTVVVVTTRFVRAGEELSVNYGDDLWFVCRCGEPTCCHRHLHGCDE